MKTLRHILTYLQAALLVGLASACHDDFQSPDPLPDVNIDTGISIRIPNLDAAATRAYGDKWNASDAASVPLQGEGAVDSEITVGSESLKDFWLFIYCADSGNAATDYAKGVAYNKAINLGAIGNLPTFESDGTTKKWAGAVKSLTVDGTSTDVKVPIHPGKYKVYLVANVHRYLVDDKGEAMKLFKASDNEYMPIEESKLQNALLKFSTGDINFDNTNNILRRGYLPMLCQPADVEEAGTGGVFDILSDNVTQLRCNMEFLCAKVRYTVLFDNTPAADGKPKGHSYDEFGTRLLQFSDLTKAVAVSNVADRAQLTGNASGVTPLAGPFYGELKSITYPDDPDDLLEPGTGTDPSDGSAASGSGSATTSPAQLAWQGVIYLPENLDASKRTKLTFNSEAVDASGNKSANPYEVELIKGGSQNGTTAADAPILRAHFYDLCLKATKLKTYEFSFTIKDWDIQQIIYDLHGPYFLEVSDTENVSVESSEPTYIAYDTNADKLDFKSATYKRGSEDIPIYDFKEVVIDGQKMIRVSINGAISAAEGKIITDATEDGSHDYDYFHVIAGNISKKITVHPLSISSFLDVDPGVININVREQKSSGIYSGAFPVTIKTNFDEYTITATNWKELISSEKNDSELMYLAYKDESGNYHRITFGEKREKPDNGSDQLYLVYTGLNDEDGSEFWSRFDHEFTLTVTAKSEDGTETDTKKIKINTKRASDNYIIYLRADWERPHIYVYQCLAFPMDAASDRAGKSLATGSDGNTAALEYSFTGKLAFKGWNVGTYNSTDGDLGDSNGFKYFKNATSSWNPKDDTGQHYFTDYDFCQEYRNSYYAEDAADKHMVCEDCAKSNAAAKDAYWGGYNILWPGICMEKMTTGENAGWWRFELTPVANPGKTLIMFAGKHDGSGGRHPGNNEVGVPLFDYPERTGWFDVKNDKKYFVSSNPDNEPEPVIVIYKYRIYWQRNYDTGDNKGAQNRDYIYIYNTGDPVLDGKCFERTGASTEGASFMNYFDFESSILPATINQKMGFIARQNSNDWTNQSGDNKVSAFTKQSDGVWKSWNQTLTKK